MDRSRGPAQPRVRLRALAVGLFGGLAGATTLLLHFVEHITYHYSFGSLLHGDLVSAVRFNALALVALDFLAVAYATRTDGRVTGRQIIGW